MPDWVLLDLLASSFVGGCLAVSSWWFWRKTRRLAGELADLERNNEALGEMLQDVWQAREETGALAIEAGELKEQNEALRRDLSWLRGNALEERSELVGALHSWLKLANAELQQTGDARQAPASHAAVALAHRTDGECASQHNC